MITRVRRLMTLVAFAAALQACHPADPASAAASAPAAALPVARAASTATPPPASSASAQGSSGEAHEAGRRIWNFRCYYCHGYSGDARTLAASFIDPAPRNFRATPLSSLSREAMLASVRDGRPGSAMVSFAGVLSRSELEQVVDFVREEFMRNQAVNTRYHTAENGWPNHDRYRVAFPFAIGQIPLDRPWDQLDADQTAGKQLFLGACVSCHDRAVVSAPGKPWEIFGVSYPPGNYTETHDEPPAAHRGAQPAAPSASPATPQAVDPYELHETPPPLKRPTALLRRGERIFQRNCAHCHAADGTGRNWIGSFLDPHPPDFTRQEMAPRLISARVAVVTRDGLPGSSMPAWRSVLSARDIAAVSAYVERAFGAPESATSAPRSARPQSAAAAPAPPARRTTDGS